MSTVSPHSLPAPRRLSPEQQKRVIAHLNLAKKKATYYFRYFCALSKKPSDGDTQKRDTMIMRKEDMVAAMYEALCEAAYNYDPGFRAEDGTPRTFGVYVSSYFNGKAMALFRAAMRKKDRLPPEELLHGHAPHTDKWARPDDAVSMIEMIPAKDTLPDGSDYDGGPGEGLSPQDRDHVQAAIRRVIQTPGLPQLLRMDQITDALLQGQAPGDLCRGKGAFQPEDVSVTLDMLRQELAPLVEDRTARPMITISDPRHVDALREGQVPGVLGTDGVWRVTPWTARALDRMTRAEITVPPTVEPALDPSAPYVGRAFPEPRPPRGKIVLF